MRSEFFQKKNAVVTVCCDAASKNSCRMREEPPNLLKMDTEQLYGRFFELEQKNLVGDPIFARPAYF